MLGYSYLYAFFHWSYRENELRFQSLKAIFLFSNLIIAFNAVAATTNDICQGVSILDITDRGSISNTPCVLSPKAAFWELGYQYKQFSPDSGLQIFPQPTFFLGLPGKSELSVVIPTYNQASFRPFSGSGAAMVGVKHEVLYGKNWVAAAEVFFTPPSGSASFGSKGSGFFLNGMATYNLSPKLSATLMVGGSTATDPSLIGGGRFNSFNPSLALSYAQTKKLRFFIETFAQTQTEYVVQGNYNVDGGVLYMLTENVVFDLEIGQQLSHQSLSFHQFIGGGVSLKL